MSERFIPKEATQEGREEYSPDVLVLATQAQQDAPNALDKIKRAVERIVQKGTDLAFKGTQEYAALCLSLGGDKEAARIVRGEIVPPENKRLQLRFDRMQRREFAWILKRPFTREGIKATGKRVARDAVFLFSLLGAAEISGCASTSIARTELEKRPAARAEYSEKETKFETKWGDSERKGKEVEKAQTAFDAADAAVAQALATWTASLGTDEEKDATENLISAIKEFEKTQTKLAAAQDAYETAMTQNYPTDTADAARRVRDAAETALQAIEAKKIAVSEAWKTRHEARRQHGEQSSKFGATNTAVGAAERDYATAGGDAALETAERAFEDADTKVRGFAERSAAKEAIDDARAEIVSTQQGVEQTSPIPALEALGDVSATSPTENKLQEIKIQLRQAERGARGLDVRKRELQRLITGREQDIASFRRQMNGAGVTDARRATLQVDKDQCERDIIRFQAEIVDIDRKTDALDRLRREEATLQNTLATEPDANRIAREGAQRAVEQYKGKHTAHVNAVRGYETARQSWNETYGAGAAHDAVERLRAQVLPVQK